MREAHTQFMAWDIDALPDVRHALTQLTRRLLA